MRKEIMSPDHPKWEEFAHKLGRAIEEQGCQAGRRERPLAREIMRKMGSIDIPATMALFEENGGCCCDCEILFNVESCWQNRARRQITAAPRRIQ